MKNLVVIFSILTFLNMGYGQKPQELRKPKLRQDTQELWGVFDSKRGVMHRLSCFGYNIGEFELYTTGEPESTVICFDRMEGGENLNLPCDSLKVTGYYESVTRENDINGPCTGGAQQIFYVTSFECYD